MHPTTLPLSSSLVPSTFNSLSRVPRANAPVHQVAVRPVTASSSARDRAAFQIRPTCLSSGLDLTPSPQAMMSTSQQLDPGMMLLRQRIIFLGTQVDDLSADAVISQLLLLDAQDPTQDIKLFINSPGGSVTAGMGIYDAMKLVNADVSTICFGLAASMGAFLLAAGTKGKRYCMPNARVMIHQPLGGAGGSAIDGALQVREMMYHKIKLNKILSRATGKPEEQIEADTDRDNFLNAWEAVEYGLVDAVIDGDKEGLVAPMGEAKDPPKSKISPLWTIKEGKEKRKLPGEAAWLKSAR